MDSEHDRPVYDALAAHQVSETEWQYQDVIGEFQRWRGIFNSEFKLDLPPTAFRIGGAKSNCYGHFRPGPNDFGLAREIAFNERCLAERLVTGEFWKALGTLLHELLHAWQHKHGRPSPWNHHNLEYRKKAESVGLLVSSRGITTGHIPDSLFFQLIARHGIATPSLATPAPRVVATHRGSKLKKWSCGCTNVRVAVADFRAQCLHCGKLFERED
jgi:hypothetical protein